MEKVAVENGTELASLDDERRKRVKESVNFIFVL